MEESTIVFDAKDGRAYRLAEGKLVFLGKGATISAVWKDVVYQIGERLYICDHGNYQRIASNSRLIEFDSPSSESLSAELISKDQNKVDAKNNIWDKSGQIRKIGEEYLFVHHDRHEMIKLPECLGETWWKNQRSVVFLPETQNAFLIDSDKEFRLFLADGSGVPKRQEPPQPSISGNSFVWNGYGYILTGEKFKMSPFKLLGIFSDYLLLALGGDVYSLDTNGLFHPLGSYPDFYGGDTPKLMVAEVEHGKMCYQLCEDVIRNVCLCTNDACLEVWKDETVHHFYTIEDGTDSSSEYHRIFRPDKSGIYVEVKE